MSVCSVNELATDDYKGGPQKIKYACVVRQPAEITCSSESAASGRIVLVTYQFRQIAGGHVPAECDS